MDPGPPLRLIQAFHHVVSAGSFTDAAATMGVSQPAVSQQIRELESLLGVQLFRRTGRGVTPTTAGAQLAGSTADPLAAIGRSLRALRARTNDHHVEIRVSSTFATGWLVPRLPGFLARHPEIEIDLTSSHWLQPTDPVHAAVQIDFGRPPTGAELIGGHETIVAVASPHTVRGMHSIDDLASCTLLDIRGGDGWAEFLDVLGAPMPRTRVHQSMTYLHTIELARAGAGIALAHRFILEAMAGRDELAIAPVGEVAAREQYYLIAPDPAAATTADRTFTEWLRAELTAAEP